MGRHRLLKHFQLYMMAVGACCRAMLAEKEAELAGAEADHAASEAQVHALSAKYDRAQSLLQRDRDALAAQQAELDDARAAARTEAERAAATAAQSARRQEELQAQAYLFPICSKHVHTTTTLKGQGIHRSHIRSAVHQTGRALSP